MSTNKYITILACVGILWGTTSCTEVIEVDLNDSDPQLVIEGILTDQPSGNAVTLTESGSYFEPGTYPAVSGATIILTDQAGRKDTLAETEPGVYPFAEGGETNGIYQLEVQSGGETYLAESSLPTAVPIDTLIFEPRPSSPFGGDFGDYVLIAEFDDPANEPTYIFATLEVNGEVVTSSLYDDIRTDGQRGSLVFFTAAVNAGDEVKVVSRSMDRVTYDYFNELVELLGVGFGASTTAPANPNSNFSNKAIGYFGAFGETVAAGVAP